MKTRQINGIVDKIDRHGLNPETLFDLRRLHPKVRFSVVTADDMEDEAPYVERDKFRVFLLASDGHCLSVTRDLPTAVGLILAEA